MPLALLNTRGWLMAEFRFREDIERKQQEHSRIPSFYPHRSPLTPVLNPFARVYTLRIVNVYTGEVKPVSIKAYMHPQCGDDWLLECLPTVLGLFSSDWRSGEWQIYKGVERVR